MASEYRERGLSTYGCKCEICGYGLVEVHHYGVTSGGT